MQNQKLTPNKFSQEFNQQFSGGFSNKFNPEKPSSILIESHYMFDTLTFSQKMQKIGMEEKIANELAFNLRDIHVNQFENLLTRNEFYKYETDIRKENENLVNKEEFRKEIDKLVTKEEFRKEIDKLVTKEEFRKEIDKLVTKEEFNAFKKDMHHEIAIIHNDLVSIHSDITNIQNEIKNNLVTKKEFSDKIKNLELNLTIRMGVIMTTGIAVWGMLIKL